MLSMALVAAVTVLGPANPQAWEKTAADELKTYLERRLGKNDLVVGGEKNPVFHVGDCDLAKAHGLSCGDLKDEEWVIRQFGKDVVINGGGTRGCLFGVYRFLEDFCGVRFWSDTETDVPSASPLALDTLDVRGKPHFPYRDIYRTENTGRFAANPRTAIRRRLNRNGNVPIPLTLGGAFEYGAPYFCHTHDRYLPYAVYGKDHPEWYSLRDGKRVGGPGKGQLCLTNPEVVEKMTELVLANIEKGAKLAAARGEAAPRVYDLTHNDNQFYCQCPRCMEAEEKCGRSGIMLNFVNPIARAVAKSHPEVFLHVCAYEYTEPVPKCPMKAEPNVVVELNNTGGNKIRPITDPTNRFFHDELEKWHAFADRLAVSDFAVTYRRETYDFPLPNEFQFENYFRHFAKNNAEMVFMQHDRPEESDMHEVKYYVESRLLEDPYQDGNRIIESAILEFYGEKVGKRILSIRRRLFESANRYVSNVTWFPYMYEFFNYIREDDVAFFRSELGQAKREVDGDLRALRRLHKFCIGFERYFACYSMHQIKADEGCWLTPASQFVLWRSSYGQFVDDPSEFGDKVLRLNRSETPYARQPFLIGTYDITKRGGRMLGGAIPSVPEDGAYHWVKLGETDCVSTGWLLYFGPTYESVLMNFRPMREMAGKTLEVFLKMKVDKEHVTLSSLRYVAK